MSADPRSPSAAKERADATAPRRRYLVERIRWAATAVEETDQGKHSRSVPVKYAKQIATDVAELLTLLEAPRGR